jgi:hypothetical protein
MKRLEIQIELELYAAIRASALENDRSVQGEIRQALKGLFRESLVIPRGNTGGTLAPSPALAPGAGKLHNIAETLRAMDEKQFEEYLLTKPANGREPLREIRRLALGADPFKE